MEKRKLLQLQAQQINFSPREKSEKKVTQNRIYRSYRLIV